ncbi:MAG: type II secretion system GspH family protein [Oscillospiraceae bacterium]|nr:type II secretion system GspH family protein [Oscillospiraceae bacterium]
MDKSKSNSLHGRFLKAFTLLELIVVIAIISVLLAVIIPNTAAYLRDSKLTAANTQAQEVYNAVQDYLIAQQIRGEKAFGYKVDTPDSEIYVAAITSGGQTTSIVHGGNGFTDDMAQKAVNGIAGTDSIKKAAGNGAVYDGYNTGYLSDGFEGAWLVCIYPKTYTVKYVLFCDEYGNDTASKVAKRDVLEDMVTSGLYANLNAQEVDANNASSDKRYVGQYPYIT